MEKLRAGRLTDSKTEVTEWADTLLALRSCARSFPARLGRHEDLPRATARYRIKRLEEEGIVTDYIPVAKPQVFGTPYLVTVRVNPKDYQFKEDLIDTVDSLREFVQSGIGHAPLVFYVIRGPEDWQVSFVIVTSNIEAFSESLYREQNIARENIETIQLSEVDGIPNYSKFSLLDLRSSRSK